MKTILVYDSDAKQLDKIADANGVSIAEIIEEMILDYMDSNEIN